MNRSDEDNIKEVSFDVMSAGVMSLPRGASLKCNVMHVGLEHDRQTFLAYLRYVGPVI